MGGGTMLKKGLDENVKNLDEKRWGIHKSDGPCPDVQLNCGDYCTATSECPLSGPCSTCLKSVSACGAGCGTKCTDWTECMDMKCSMCTNGKCARISDAETTEEEEEEVVEIPMPQPPVDLPPDYCPTAVCVQNGGCATSTDEIVCTYPTSFITSG